MSHEKKLSWSMLALSLLLCLVLPLLVGEIGTTSMEIWYPLLRKPSWTPPSWVFGPVWGILYILMGISLWLVWKAQQAQKKHRATPYILFGLQLLANVIWTPLFFGLESPFLGLLDIVVLWFFLLLTIFAFFPISRWAAYLLLPYWLWVSYATTLNAALWWINR